MTQLNPITSVKEFYSEYLHLSDTELNELEKNLPDEELEDLPFEEDLPEDSERRNNMPEKRTPRQNTPGEKVPLDRGNCDINDKSDNKLKAH